MVLPRALPTSCLAALLAACAPPSSAPGPIPEPPTDAPEEEEPAWDLQVSPSWLGPERIVTTLVIDEGQPLQTLDGIGANAYPFPIQSVEGWDWDAVAPTLEELGLDYVRVVSWFQFWESVNDDDDPWHIEWSGFNSEVASLEWWDVPFTTWLTDRGIEPMVGIWNVADWLASGDPRRIDPADYDELGESITAYHLAMREAGIELRYAEVQNEPNIVAHVRYDTPEDLRDAARTVLDHLDAAGLHDVMLHGPNSNHADEVLPWAEAWFADEVLTDRTVAVSYHTWRSHDVEDYDAIRQLAQEHGKQVWATEVGYCPQTEGCYDDTHFLLSHTWGTALDASVSAWRAIVWSQAHRVYHWAAIGYDPAIDEAGGKLPTWYGLKHFTDAVPPGAVHVGSASPDPDVLIAAFAMPDSDALTAVVIHRGEQPTSARLLSARGTAWTIVGGATSAEDAYGTDAVIDPAGVVSLPARSVTNLRLEPR